jgi:hypothetical protein
MSLALLNLLAWSMWRQRLYGLKLFLIELVKAFEAVAKLVAVQAKAVGVRDAEMFSAPFTLSGGFQRAAVDRDVCASWCTVEQSSDHDYVPPPDEMCIHVL